MHGRGSEGGIRWGEICGRLPLPPLVRRGVVVASVAIEKTEETAEVLKPNSHQWATRTARRPSPTVRVASALQWLLAGLVLADRATSGRR